MTPFDQASQPACSDSDPEVFFDEARTLQALALCAACPIRSSCLDYALDNEEFGVWGGATPEMRRAVRGGPLAGTPEDRHLVWSIHGRIARGDNVADVAGDLGVNERTLYRWMARADADQAAA